MKLDSAEKILAAEMMLADVSNFLADRETAAFRRRMIELYVPVWREEFRRNRPWYRKLADLFA